MVLHKFRITTWALVYSSMSKSMKNPSEGVVASSEKCKLKQHEYQGTQQDLHQILHTCTLSRRVGGVIAASQLWLFAKLSYETPTWNGFAHTSPLLTTQYTTEDPPPSSYGRAILGTHAYLAYFRVSTFTCLWTDISNPEVLYRGRGYSNRLC